MLLVKRILLILIAGVIFFCIDRYNIAKQLSESWGGLALLVAIIVCASLLIEQVYKPAKKNK